MPNTMPSKTEFGKKIKEKKENLKTRIKAKTSERKELEKKLKQLQKK